MLVGISVEVFESMSLGMAGTLLCGTVNFTSEGVSVDMKTGVSVGMSRDDSFQL